MCPTTSTSTLSQSLAAHHSLTYSTTLERLDESPSGTLSLAHGTCSSSTQQPSKPKYSQISWSSGRRFRHQAPQTYQIHGQCSSMGPRDNKESGHELCSSPLKEQS